MFVTSSYSMTLFCLTATVIIRMELGNRGVYLSNQNILISNWILGGSGRFDLYSTIFSYPIFYIYNPELLVKGALLVAQNIFLCRCQKSIFMYVINLNSSDYLYGKGTRGYL